MVNWFSHNVQGRRVAFFPNWWAVGEVHVFVVRLLSLDRDVDSVVCGLTEKTLLCKQKASGIAHKSV